MTSLAKKFDGFKVNYDVTDEIKDSVFERVMEFFIKHQAFSGESIMQSDGPVIDAPNVLADIADDIIKFGVEWNDE